jgi:hypothetical protein
MDLNLFFNAEPAEPWGTPLEEKRRKHRNQDGLWRECEIVFNCNLVLLSWLLYKNRYRRTNFVNKAIMSLFTAFIFLMIACIPLEPANKRLITAEYRVDSSGSGNYTELVSYDFQAGKLIARKILFGAPVTIEGKAGSYVRFDLGYNRIYKNRYVISAFGNVIDLETKSLILGESDEFIEALGDVLVFHRDNISTGQGFLTLDLKTGKYEFVRDKSFRAVKGIQSPDLKHGLEIDKSRLPYSVTLFDENNVGTTILDDCGTGTTLSRAANTESDVPIKWIDNDRFIYAHFKSNMVRLRIINIHDQTNELVSEIKSISPALINAGFYKDPDNNLMFYFSGGTYRIDVPGRSILKSEYWQMGNRFQVEIKSDDKGRNILYENEKIGTLWCDGYTESTIAGYFAVAYGEPGTNLGYTKGIKVWNNEKRDWTTIDVPWLCAIIGWVE